MSRNQAQFFQKQNTGVLVGVLLTHVALIALFTIGMSQNKHLNHSKAPIQLPIPLPMTMVDIIQTPGATGNPNAAITPNYQPNPSTETQAKSDSAANSISKPTPQHQSASKTLKNSTERQNTKASSMVTDSKTAITGSEKVSNASNGTGTNEGVSSGNGSGSDSGNSRSGSGNGTGNNANTGAQSAGSIGPATAPSFGAAYLNNPAPKYPPIARRQGEQGKVVLKVLVTADGYAKEVNLHKSSGFSSLDESAITAVKKWRFVPAKQGGDAIEAWVKVPIVFKLDS